MSRYPFTGPNYAQYGEVAGYIYYPWNDQYYIDPQMVQSYNESVGLAEPTPREPSYWDTLLPVAGAAAALSGGTALGNKLITGEWPSWLGGGSAATTEAATQAVTNVAQPASQIAMGGSNSLGGAVAAGGELGGGLEAGRSAYLGSIPSGAEVGTFDAAGPIGSNIGTVAQGALGAAGLGLGLHGMYGAYESGNPLGGAISGAGAGAGGLALAGALGASTGGLALPVIAGAALLGGGLGFLGDRETGAEQIAKRVSELEQQGVNIPQPLLADLASYGLSKDDLVAREQAKIQSGQHGNVAFAQSRNVKDLTPLDTVGGLMWMETLGNEYFSGFTPEQRLAMNQQALSEGLITEGRGQLNFKDKERAKQIAEATRAGQIAPIPLQPPPPATSSTSAPKPVSESTLVSEGKKQIELGNMQPAGMIPSQQQQGGQQPMQGYKPTPQQIGQMQVPQQPQGMIPAAQNTAIAPWSPQAVRQQMLQMGQGYQEMKNMSAAQPWQSPQQMQMPQGMIPQPAQPQQPAPVQPTVQPAMAPPPQPQQLGRRAGYRWDPYLNQYVEL
jgi:hypothetical protein